jgi:hypothetical protein
MVTPSEYVAEVNWVETVNKMVAARITIISTDAFFIFTVNYTAIYFPV